MEDVIGALAQLGPVGIVLIILIVVGYQWRQSSKGYSTELARITSWYKGELERIDQDRDDGFKSLKEEIAGLKAEIRILRQDLEAERAARRIAEETAHELRTKVTP
jgi:signal transduction histidine kinase